MTAPWGAAGPWRHGGAPGLPWARSRADQHEQCVPREHVEGVRPTPSRGRGRCGARGHQARGAVRSVCTGADGHAPPAHIPR